MENNVRLIYADGHILEPPGLWERYLEPKYRDRAMRLWVGNPHERTIAAMTRLAGADKFFWATDYPHPDHPAITWRS